MAGAVAVTLHAVLGRRDAGTTIGWIGLAWLVPIVGPLIYYAFGINRIRRRAVALRPRRNGPPHGAARMLESDYRIRDELLAASPNLAGLVRLGSSLKGRPVLPGNSVETLIDGDEAFPAMLEAIREARRSLTLSTFIFDSDPLGEEFFAELRAARVRGVAVRVLIDHVGSRYSPRSMVDRIEESGIPAAAFLPTRTPRFLPYANLRNHRKILVADGRVGFTGGMNVREGHWLGRRPESPARDLHFRLEGPIVADLQSVFATDWAFVTGELIEGEAWFPELERAGSTGARGIPAGPDEDVDHMVAVVMGALAVASRRVGIVTPYFLPDSPILRALAVTSARGVRVDILVPERSNIPGMSWATSAVLEPLLEAGCRIHYSGPPFDHSKLMVVDDVWSFIGSMNWDVRSMRLNFEFNVECYGRGLAQRLVGVMDEKLEAAREVTLEEIRSRSFPENVRNGLARLATPYM